MEKYVAGTHMTQEEYTKLKKACETDNKQYSLADIKSIINKWFGFEFSRIEMEVNVQSFMVENGKIKPTGGYAREPMYDATDWNYIRFNVCNNQYEIINGELFFYED